jgi:ubiquinone/menaquinone biosynthesis C-methylase UbiE
MDSRQIDQAIASTYDSLSEKYERTVVPIYRPIAKRLLQFIDLRPGWRILDAGTGTGLVALLGAPRVGKDGKMIGVDASEGMLAIARKKAAQFGFSQCEFRVGDFEALEYPEATFNACLSQFALHYTDLNRSLRELHRVLQPNGALVIQVWAADSNAPHKAMWDALDHYRAQQADGALAALRAQSERLYAFRQTYGTPDAMKAAVESAGFAKVQSQAEEHPTRVANVEAFFEIASASPALISEINALSDESRQSFYRDARATLKKFETANVFEWTFHVLAVLAKKM